MKLTQGFTRHASRQSSLSEKPDDISVMSLSGRSGPNGY